MHACSSLQPVLPSLFHVFILRFACLAVLLLGGLGGLLPAAAAASAASGTAVRQARHRGLEPAWMQLLLDRPEALSRDTEALPGTSFPLAPPLLGGALPAPAWREAAARAAALRRRGALPDYFRRRLLQTAISPQAP